MIVSVWHIFVSHLIYHICVCVVGVSFPHKGISVRVSFTVCDIVALLNYICIAVC